MRKQDAQAAKAAAAFAACASSSRPWISAQVLVLVFWLQVTVTQGIQGAWGQAPHQEGLRYEVTEKSTSLRLPKKKNRSVDKERRQKESSRAAHVEQTLGAAAPQKQVHSLRFPRGGSKACERMSCARD